MDKQTVFVKTKEGEEAMRQRTRLVQRNLRNILIMVDGHASVADLCRRFGDENAAQVALAELLAGGFIEAPSGSLDFASSRPQEAPAGKAEDVPVLTTQVGAQPAQNAVFEPPPTLPPDIEEIELHAPEYESLPPPSLQPAAPPRREAAPAAAGPGWAERIRALFARVDKPAIRQKQAQKGFQGGEAAGTADLAPIRRGPSLFVSWPLLALIAVVGVAVLLALTFVLYPYGRHLPDIERNASAMLQDPVKVGDIGFSFLPRPHIVLRDISVGKEAHLTIASARAVPDFFSLLGGRKVFHELIFNNVAVKEAGLARLALAGAVPAEIRGIAVNDLRLTIGGAVLGDFDGEVQMAVTGAPEKILLRNAEGTLKLELQPKAGGFSIIVSGSGWKTPFKPNLTFQTIDAQGLLRPSRLELSKFDIRAYDGLAEGKATLDWTGSAMLAAEIELKHMNSTKLLAALGSDLATEGELAARLKLDGKADSLGTLGESLHAGATFELKRGAARGFDLGEAVRSTVRTPTRGGETRFEQLSGTLQFDPRGYRISNLRLASGLLMAGGNLGVAGNGQLSGTMNVELKSSATTLRMPLAISGATKDPLLTLIRGR